MGHQPTDEKIRRLLGHVKAVHPNPYTLVESTPLNGVRHRNAVLLIEKGLCEWYHEGVSIVLTTEGLRT